MAISIVSRSCALLSASLKAARKFFSWLAFVASTPRGTADDATAVA